MDTAIALGLAAFGLAGTGACAWLHGYITGRQREAPAWVAAGRQVDQARRCAVALEQDQAEALRLLTDLVQEASDLDAWPSAGRTRALDAAREHLAAVTA